MGLETGNLTGIGTCLWIEGILYLVRDIVNYLNFLYFRRKIGKKTGETVIF